MRDNIGLYRGKRLDTDEWVEGSLVIAKDRINKGKYYIIATVSDISYGDGGNRIRIGCFVEVDPSTVGEYSGYRNKLGKQFVEGDIVRNRSKWSGNTGVVVFRNGRFKVDWRSLNSCSEKGTSARTDDLCADDEIVGNIHDNPELLSR